VLSANKSKYAGEFHAIVDAMNKGKYNPSVRVNIPSRVEKKETPSELIAIKNGIDKLNKNLSDKEQWEYRDGYRIMRKGNLTRRING
jgi:hypothetical protein